MYRGALAGPGPSTLAARLLWNRAVLPFLDSRETTASLRHTLSPTSRIRTLGLVLRPASSQAAFQIDEDGPYLNDQVTERFEDEIVNSNPATAVPELEFQEEVSAAVDARSAQYVTPPTEEEMRYYGGVNYQLRGLFQNMKTHSFVALVLQRPREWEAALAEAVEAAARDEWHGLYFATAALLRAGMPSEIPEIYDRYLERLADVQGRKKEDLQSPNRLKRVAARPTGNGLRPMTYCYLAAITVMQKVNGSTLARVCDLGDILTGSAREVSTLSRIVSPDDTGQFQAQLARTFDLVSLVLMCFHSKALGRRLSVLIRQDAHDTILSLFRQILDASIGADRVLQPVYTVERVGSLRFYNCMPLSSHTWSESSYTTRAIADCSLLSALFIMAFSASMDIKSLGDLFDVYLPERGVRPDGMILGEGMLALGRIAALGPLDRRLEAESRATQLWDNYVRGGLLDEGLTVAYRMEYLYRYEKTKVLHFHRQASTGIYGPLVQRYWTALITYHLEHGEHVLAVKLFRAEIQGTDAKLRSSRDKNPYYAFAREAVRYYPRKQAIALIREVAASKPQHHQLTAEVHCIVLSTLLDMGANVDLAVANTVQTCRVNGVPLSNAETWLRMLFCTLEGADKKIPVNLPRARAALTILKAYSQEEIICNRISSTTDPIWATFFGNILNSTALDPDLQNELLQEAFDLYPIHHCKPLQTVVVATVQDLLRSSDTVRIRQALILYHWVTKYRTRQRDIRFLNETMVLGMLHHGQKHIARILLEDLDFSDSPDVRAALRVIDSIDEAVAPLSPAKRDELLDTFFFADQHRARAVRIQRSRTHETARRSSMLKRRG